MMSAPNALCPACGGPNEPSTRTYRHGDGENVVPYLHYLLKCSLCGRETEDERLRSLNESGAARALGLSR
jgi:hypothetical protein